MRPESLAVLRFQRIHECMRTLLIMTVIRRLLCRIRACGSLVKAGARLVEIRKRAIARQVGKKTLKLVVGAQKSRRVVALYRRPEFLKCRVVCRLVKRITRTVGQGHIPMLDLISVFEFGGRRGALPRCGASRFALAVTAGAARRNRRHTERQN